ncbi:TolC family protein, partial [bacterium]|nr:TolC family protein [bacterium]
SIGYSKKEEMSERSIMVQQKFPYPGKLSLMGEVENQQVRMIEQELSATTLKKISQTKKDYYEFFLINKEIEVTNRTKEYLKLIEEIANTMYSTGMIPQVDILRIQTEILMEIERIIMLEAQKESMIYRIMWYSLGLPQDAPEIIINLPNQLKPTELKDYETLQDIALEKSPMLKMVGYEIEMRRKEVDLAKREFKPDFVSSAELMDSNNWSLRFGIMYPLYKDKKQKNALIEAEKGLLSIQKGYENERLELLYMLKEAYLMAKAATQNIKLYKTAILPQANLSYTSALANYKTGKIDFLMLFDNLMRLQESELRYYELLVEHEKQASEIERLVGGEL